MEVVWIVWLQYNIEKWHTKRMFILWNSFQWCWIVHSIQRLKLRFNNPISVQSHLILWEKNFPANWKHHCCSQLHSVLLKLRRKILQATIAIYCFTNEYKMCERRERICVKNAFYYNTFFYRLVLGHFLSYWNSRKF